MRSAIVGLFVVLTACGAANPMAPKLDQFIAVGSGQAAGTIFFKIDAASCTYVGTRSTTFYINNVEVGTEDIAPGQTSVGYAASGYPVVQARIANWSGTAALWTLRSTVAIPASGTVTHIFTC